MNNVVTINQSVKKNFHVTTESLHLLIKSAQSGTFMKSAGMVDRNIQIILKSNF